MIRQKDLTNGKILPLLTKLALPIMGTSFVQMAYNLIDMMWLGKVGSMAVAAVGAAGFFMWLGNAIVFTTKIGAEVGVSQSVGRKDSKATAGYASAALIIASLVSLLYTVLLFTSSTELISFFQFDDRTIIERAATYLRIVSVGTLFAFINPTFTGIYNGLGNSRKPFVIHTAGLLLNIILDPILIFGIGPFPIMEEKGAAIATVLAQILVFMVFVIDFYGKSSPFPKINVFKYLSWQKIKNVLKIGLPVSTHQVLFCIIAMVIARMVSRFGALPIAVQSVGVQIESLSWMTASGFSTAIGAFTGQNFGAGEWGRIKQGYFWVLGISSIIGILATLLFWVFGKEVFSIFMTESDALELGVVYLKILAVSQLFMCIEITTSGGFVGIGRTIIPSSVGIIFNALRIPAAYALTTTTSLGVAGIWWCVSGSSIFKGVILFLWFVLVLSFLKDKDVLKSETNGKYRMIKWLVPYKLRYRKSV